MGRRREEKPLAFLRPDVGKADKAERERVAATTSRKRANKRILRRKENTHTRLAWLWLPSGLSVWFGVQERPHSSWSPFLRGSSPPFMVVELELARERHLANQSWGLAVPVLCRMVAPPRCCHGYPVSKMCVGVVVGGESSLGSPERGGGGGGGKSALCVANRMRGAGEADQDGILRGGRLIAERRFLINKEEEEERRRRKAEDESRGEVSAYSAGDFYRNAVTRENI